MKRNNFVMLEEFDEIYKDLGWVDYYSITKITDDAITMVIYTKKEISKEDAEFDVLVSRNIDLGDKLGKEIIWDYKVSSYNFFSKLFRKLKKRI